MLDSLACKACRQFVINAAVAARNARSLRSRAKTRCSAYFCLANFLEDNFTMLNFPEDYTRKNLSGVQAEFCKSG